MRLNDSRAHTHTHLFRWQSPGVVYYSLFVDLREFQMEILRNLFAQTPIRILERKSEHARARTQIDYAQLLRATRQFPTVAWPPAPLLPHSSLPQRPLCISSGARACNGIAYRMCRRRRRRHPLATECQLTRTTNVAVLGDGSITVGDVSPRVTTSRVFRTNYADSRRVSSHSFEFTAAAALDASW